MTTTPDPHVVTPETSDKGFVPAVLLCFFLGSFGLHRFYLGKWVTGILMLVTFGAFGIWTLIDFVRLVVGSLKDKQDRPLRR
ncbi:TM2 domain-containing protein [Rhodobacteraceae bacterium]|nr:TM2 domain-containing protein [Paracoccaceae bacterium]